MKPPRISVPTNGGPPRYSRFERLYAEGAQRSTRRKNLEKSVMEEEVTRLRKEIASTRQGKRNDPMQRPTQGFWERMSKHEADARASKLQKMREELMEKERQEMEASKFCPPSRHRPALNGSSAFAESMSQHKGSSMMDMVGRMSKDAVDTRRAKVKQLTLQYSAEEEAKIDAARFKKPGKSAKTVDIREITNRLYADGEKRRAKLEQMQEEAELREIAECQGFRPRVSQGSTFQPLARVPRMDKRDRDVTGSIPGTSMSAKRKSAGHQRLYAESQARKERMEKLAQAVKAEEDKECTYQPNLRKSLGRYRPTSSSNLGGRRSPIGSGGVHENLYRERAARDERIRKMREEKKALEVCSMGSRSTPKTPMGKDLHASLHDEAHKRKAEAEAVEKEKEEMVKSLPHASRRTPVGVGLSDGLLFEESKMKNDDALMMRVKEKEERKAAVLDKGRATTMKPSTSVGLPLVSSANRRARSCDSTMAGRRGVSRLEAKTDGVEGQTRPPEVFSIDIPDVTPDSSSRSSRPHSADQPRRSTQKIILGFKEEVKIPKRRKPVEASRLETAPDQPDEEREAPVEGLARVILSDIITIVEEKTTVTIDS